MKNLAFLASTVCFLTSTISLAITPAEMKIESYLDSIKSEPQKLESFLRVMPKGGDLHNHLSGAAYAENMIRYANNDSLCVNRKTLSVYNNSSCEYENILNNAIKDKSFYNQLIDAWSIRNFQGDSKAKHDHFFITFRRFSPISESHMGQMLAEIVKRAALQTETYLELMVTADNNESGRLGKQLGWDTDFSKMREKLLAHDFDKIVASISNNLDHIEAEKNATLGCDKNQLSVECTIKVRYLYQVLREQPPEMVFAQLLAGFEAANKEPRVVGLNIVQAEDGAISMHDYSLHMQMFAYLQEQYPNVSFSLHAGELNNTLVSAEDLTFHINQAISVAKAKRIGHGVDIVYETDSEQLLKTMAQNSIPVEINLSSNAFILDVQGKNHPLPLYKKFDVPIILSTDDEGINRSNLTKEYKFAVDSFQLDYLTLKTIARNSLTYSFLPGKSLWENHAYQEISLECQNDILGSNNPSMPCQEFLNLNEKASLQWHLEQQFQNFEKTIIKNYGE